MSNINEFKNEVLDKLDTVSNLLQPTNQQVKQQNIWGSGVLADYAMQSKPSSTWRPKSNFPIVMDEDGNRPIFADQIIRRYMGDSPLGGGMGAAGLSYNYIAKLNNTLIDNTFLGYQECSILSQNGILGKICSTLADQMTNKWIELKGMGGDSEKKILELQKEMERLNVQSIYNWTLYVAFTNGTGVVYPKIKGDENNSERGNELFIDSMKINKGDLQYFKTIEPIWYVPIQYNTLDPFSEWFYVPEYYSVVGQITHHSRMFKLTYDEPLNLLKPLYLFNGIPLLQKCTTWVAKFETCYNELINIIKRFNLSVLKTNIESLIDDTNTSKQNAAANIKNRLDIFNAFRNNLGTLAIAKEEDFEQIQMTLTGLDGILNQMLELIAIVPGIPITVLFGTSPKGMNATGESDMRIFYDRISSLQNKMVKDSLVKTIHLCMLNIWGEIDENITFEFVKLHESNKLEDSQIRFNDAQSANLSIQNGTITPMDNRNRLANDPSSGYDSIETEERETEGEVSSQFSTNPGLWQDPNTENETEEIID